MTLLAINGSPSERSRTRSLAVLAVALEGGTVLDVSSIDAGALLGRGAHPTLTGALEAIEKASVLVLATPVYRATYSGLLKTLLDQLPQGALSGKAVVLVATGGSPAHYLSLDTGLRAVVASLHGWSVPTVVYATPEHFGESGEPGEAITGSLATALGEARSVVASR